MSESENKTISLDRRSLLQFCLSWKSRQTDGEEFDLDLSAFLLDYRKKVPDKSFFIYYDNKLSPVGAVALSGDNRTGEGDKDSALETISLNLDNLEPEVQRIAFVVSLYDGEQRKQNFVMVEDAVISVWNRTNNKKIFELDLTEDTALACCVVVAVAARVQGDWQLQTKHEALEGDILSATKRFGIKARRE